MALKKKSVVYRQAVFLPADGPTLQELLKRATSAPPDGIAQPWERNIGASNQIKMLLTDVFEKQGCTCGELVEYDHTRKLPLVSIGKKGKTLQQRVEPKDEKGNKRDFQEKSLFFAILGNHLAISQTTAFTTEHLEGFLFWLIGDQAKILNKSTFGLQNIPSKQALEKLKDNKVRGVSLKQRVFSEDDRESRKKKTSYKLESTAGILAFLKSLSANSPIIDALQDSADPGAIDIEIAIAYRSRSEKEGRALLNVLANSLGTNESLDTEITLEGGGKISHGELLIRDDLEVQHDGGCLMSDDVLSKLATWLVSQISSGKV